MAKYRNVSVRFWSDPWVSEELTPEKRYFFLYLLTNEHTAQCGIYGITMRQMAFETGYNQETIQNLIQFFEAKGKIKWSKDTNEIAIKNFVKYNPQGSPQVKSFVEKELLEVKNKDLIPYLYPIDTPSQREEEQEEENKEKKKSKSPTLEERKIAFGQSLTQFVAKHGKEMVRQFYEYWTETNEGGKIMRFEDQKFFALPKRIATWAKNEKKFFKKTENGQVPTTIASPLVKREIHA
jgi:hypothetical protein